MVKPKVEIVDLSEIKLDLHNANRHTERGTYMVRESISRHGFSEPGTLDRHNRVIHGGNRTEGAADLGFEKAVIIEADGKTAVYLKRPDMDLDDPKTGARELAYALNRSAEVSINLDPATVIEDVDAGVDLSPYYHEEELERMRAAVEGEDGIDPSLIPDEDRYQEQYGVIIICEDAAQQEAVYNEMVGAGYTCKVVVT